MLVVPVPRPGAPVLSDRRAARKRLPPDFLRLADAEADRDLSRLAAAAGAGYAPARRPRESSALRKRPTSDTRAARALHA